VWLWTEWHVQLKADISIISTEERCWRTVRLEMKLGRWQHEIWGTVEGRLQCTSTARHVHLGNCCQQPSTPSIQCSDGNKTKMLRPRPVKHQQECIAEKKLFCCNTHVCYQKITWCKKSQKKVMTSYGWHCFCTYCHGRKNTSAYYISALSCHTASCRHIQC